MKKLLFAIAMLFSVTSFAQKSDTLNIPVGKYKFIKIGDKVYEIETKLKEVEQGLIFNSKLFGTITTDLSFRFMPYNNGTYPKGTMTAPYYGTGTGTSQIDLLWRGDAFKIPATITTEAYITYPKIYATEFKVIEYKEQ